jgi:hypothetical protein
MHFFSLAFAVITLVSAENYISPEVTPGQYVLVDNGECATVLLTTCEKACLASINVEDDFSITSASTDITAECTCRAFGGGPDSTDNTGIPWKDDIWEGSYWVDIKKGSDAMTARVERVPDLLIYFSTSASSCAAYFERKEVAENQTSNGERMKMASALFLAMGLALMI